MWHCQKLNKPRKQGHALHVTDDILSLRKVCKLLVIYEYVTLHIIAVIATCCVFHSVRFFMSICAKLGQYSETRFFTGTTKRRVINLRSPGRLQCPPRLLCKWVAEAFCPAAKYPGCKFNHYDPTSAELTRGQGYNCSTLPYLHETLICPTLRIHLHINVLSSVQQLSARY